MRLQLMSWPEVESHLERSSGVIVPIGATEQHGPTGLIGTDAICAETLAWKVGELTGAVVAPTSRIFGPTDFRRRYPEGRLGSHPQLASVEAGRWITDEVAEDLAADYRKFSDED